MTRTAARTTPFLLSVLLLLAGAPAAAEKPPPADADVGVTAVAEPDPAQVGGELRYLVEVTNHGPGGAADVSLTATLDDGLAFVSATATRGGRCTHSGEASGGAVACDLKRLPRGSSRSVEVLAETTEGGTVVTVVEAGSGAPDPDGANNQAQVTTTVEGEGGGEQPIEPACDAAWCPIQPGALLGDRSSGFCSMGFLFRNQATGSLLMSTAAHCTEEVGERMHAEQAEETFDMQPQAFGTVVFRTDGLDFALIEIDEGREPEVSASVRHWTGPLDVSLAGTTALGDQVMYYGYGLAFDFTPQLRPRRGILMNHNEQEYQSNSAGMFGDSGAAVLHQSGNALGLISRFNILEDGVSIDLGPTVQGMLAFLDGQGWDVALVGAQFAPPPPPP